MAITGKKNFNYSIWYFLFGFIILLLLILIALLLNKHSVHEHREHEHREHEHREHEISEQKQYKSLGIHNESVSYPALHQVTPQTIENAKQRPMCNGQAKVNPHDNPEYPMRRGVIPADYQQVGILSSKDLDEDPIILPLFGRKMISRDRWEYYTASDKYNMWKLPVQYLNRDCQSDVGCDEIYNGVEVVVPEYANKVFVAKIYKYGNVRN